MPTYCAKSGRLTAWFIICCSWTFNLFQSISAMLLVSELRAKPFSCEGSTAISLLISSTLTVWTCQALGWLLEARYSPP